MQACYQNEPRFNGVYSRDNLLDKKHDAYIVNLAEYNDNGSHWIAYYVNNNILQHTLIALGLSTFQKNQKIY